VEQSLSRLTLQKEKLAQPCLMDWVWRERQVWSSETCRRLTEAGSAGGPLPYLSPNSVADERVAQQLHWPALVTPLWGRWTSPIERPAVRTACAANFTGQNFHQYSPCVRNDHRANRDSAFIALEVGLLSAYRDDKATTTIDSARELVRDYRVALFIVRHTSIIRVAVHYRT
jgi:hypothetical protein